MGTYAIRCNSRITGPSSVHSPGSLSLCLAVINGMEGRSIYNDIGIVAANEFGCLLSICFIEFLIEVLRGRGEIRSADLKPSFTAELDNVLADQS